MANHELRSPNFSFLAEQDPDLALFAIRAERYVFDDPNTSIMKSRQFAELIAKAASRSCGFDTEGDEFGSIVSRCAWIGPRASVAPDCLTRGHSPV